MIKNKRYLFSLILILSLVGGFLIFQSFKENEDFVSYEVNPKQKNLKFYWKDDKNENIRSLLGLKNYLQSKKEKLVFATNGGMYKKDSSPQGLFIENNQTLMKIDTSNGNGNFYLKPNGIFYITNEKKAFICKTEDFRDNKTIKYATQSGPMLVIDGKIHSAFKENSSNLNIRNGVGVLPNNNLIFAMSRTEINFYDFAKYFKDLGCKNALYLDGFVSRTYCPEKNWIQNDGNFGVIIGVTNLKK